MASISNIAVAADADCVITETSCQCSGTDRSGICMHSRGNDSCVLGLCNEGYRCDCFGYEMCELKSCSLHTSDANTTPSEITPFKCHLTPYAGTCTTATGVLDTVPSADKAAAESSKNDEDACQASITAIALVVDAQNENRTVRGAMREIDGIEFDVPAAELRKIEDEATVVCEAVEKAAELALMSIREADTASKGSRESRAFRRQAHRKQRELEGDKVALEKEHSKRGPSNRDDKEEEGCEACQTLQNKIARLEAERKVVARKSGEKAKEVRKARRKSQNRSREGSDVIVCSRSAASSCMQKLRVAVDKYKGR